jgi:hypothetical protein
LASQGPGCSDRETYPVGASCPNDIPPEGTACEPGLVCTYVDPLGCTATFDAVCGEAGVWEHQGRCVPDGGTGGQAGQGGSAGTGGSGGIGGFGGFGGHGGGGSTPCIDPVDGAPTVTSAATASFPADATFGAYELSFSEPVTNVTSNLSWTGAGSLGKVTKIGATTYRVEFSGISPGDSSTLTVGTGVRDACANHLAAAVPIDLSLLPACNYYSQAFEGDFLAAGWSAVDNAGDGNRWARSDQLNPPTGVTNHSGGTGLCASANDVATGAGSAWDTELRAPAIDLSSGTDVALLYRTDFEDQAGAGQAWLEASSDGTSWDTLTQWTNDRGPRREIVDLSTYVGGSVYLRWVYSDDGGTGAWWDVDDVCVQEFTRATCSCPVGGRPEALDVLGVSNGNGTLGTAEATNVTLAAVGQKLTVCGMLEDSAASGPDYHAFDVNSGTPSGLMQARLSYCLENAFEDATIRVWVKSVPTPIATLDTAHTAGSFDVALVDGATHYVSIESNGAPYTPTKYSVSLEIESAVTPILTEGFETWPPTSLTVTNDDGCLDWYYADQTTVPSGHFPTEGAYLAYFNSYDCPNGSESLESAPFSLTGATTVSLSFDMFHDPGYSGAFDEIQIQYDAGSGWTDIGSPFVRPAAVAGWTQETLDLSALAGSSSVRIRLRATSSYGNNIHIDDVVLLSD